MYFIHNLKVYEKHEIFSQIEQYGGAVCKSRKDATHIFTWNDSNKQTCSKRVDLNWLKNCVTERKIV